MERKINIIPEESLGVYHVQIGETSAWVNRRELSELKRQINTHLED